MTTEVLSLPSSLAPTQAEHIALSERKDHNAPTFKHTPALDCTSAQSCIYVITILISAHEMIKTQKTRKRKPNM